MHRIVPFVRLLGAVLTFIFSSLGTDAEASTQSNPRHPIRQREYLVAQVKGIADTSPIVVEEGVGFDEITVGNPRCTKEFIKSKLGQPDYETEQWMNYKGRYGLDFWMPSSKGPLREIRLNRGFRGKLTSNISLSSSMGDVFGIYGKPVAEQIVDDFGGHHRNRTLYRRGNSSKVFYKENGLLIWFVGEQISQIVIHEKTNVSPTQTPPAAIQPRQTKAPEMPDIPIDQRYPRWGPVARVHKLWDYVKKLWIYWYYTLAALMITGFLLKNALRRLYYRWRPLPEGRLLVVRDPTGGKVDNINIWYEARRLKKRHLMVGSGREADIQLPHESVNPEHVWISARRSEGGVLCYLKPLGSGHVVVNGAHKMLMPLSENADVRIGKFRFKYEKPNEYRQVQARYKNGRVVEGVPASWDIDSEGFTLIPSKAPSWIEAKFIRFKKLKGVYFVRDWDEDVRKKLLKGGGQTYRHPATVHFMDNEVLPGYLIGDREKQNRRFYFFPEDQSGDTVYILVERSSVKSVSEKRNFQ